MTNGNAIKKAAKNLQARPSKRTVQSTVTRLIHDIDHTRKASVKTKRSVLLRLGKLLSRAAYAAIVIGALKITFDLRGKAFREFAEKYVQGTLSIQNIDATSVSNSLTTRASDVFEYTDAIKSLYENVEFWYEKLGFLSTGAKALGGYVAWRANPGRRLR